MAKVNEKDMFDEVLRKQETKNKDEFAGMSMAEIAAKKRAETEKQIAEAQNDPKKIEAAERKARLLAQRDKLREAQELKRKQELEEFNQKTETKSDLFSELKKMDANLKDKQEEIKKKEEDNARRLEQFRKARMDLAKEDKAANEANYNKRVDELEKKEKKPAADDDWMNAKAYGDN